MKNTIQKVNSYIAKYKHYRLVKRLINSNVPIIFLFGSPHHSNMGDQAQTYCILKWFEKNYPNHEVCIFTLRETTNLVLNLIRSRIKKEDKLFCHSGYHMTDLYNEQDAYLRVIRLFPDFPIVLFPQTVFYKTSEAAINTASVLNKHGNVTLLCRDEISFNSAKTLFTGCKLLLYPDVVTSLIGTVKYCHPREGILLCIRNDKEAFYSKEQISALSSKLESVSSVSHTDTTVSLPFSYIKQRRENVIFGIIEDYSKYKVIITDRYHGTIFSLIAGTPVIVIASSDHKLSSGVKWFPDSFKEHVCYAENLEQAYEYAVSKFNQQLEYSLPPYFKENYWDLLKEKIEKTSI